jgi:hypothetical protein
MKIVLPCRTIDDLDWTSILASIDLLEKIEWEFDMGLNAPYFPIDDELYFSSLKLALSRFTKDIWPLYAERTTGATLYRGSADFASFFLWTGGQEENWNVWKETRLAAPEAHLRRLFCADAFAHYFQMLAHALPDELPVTLHFCIQGCGSAAERRQLLSRERFEHFHLVTEESTASLAICMPEEALCSGTILAKLDQLLTTLIEPYRIIEEAFLTELWEGVDRLYVIPEAISVQGKRKLMGFCAAGGLVIVEGESLGLPNEVSGEEYRGRGI